ncbi:unnamed protein product [Sphagnum balticum]
MPHDIYEISGRVKNLIATEDIALAQNGTYLVNLFSLFLKELYDFSETLPGPQQGMLQEILSSHESLPCNIMKLSAPKDENRMSLYDQFMEAKAQFNSTEEAFQYFYAEYQNLGYKYGMSGDDFWMEAEEHDGNYSYKTKDYEAIRTLHMQLAMCRYLINKDLIKKANTSE